MKEARNNKGPAEPAELGPHNPGRESPLRGKSFLLYPLKVLNLFGILWAWIKTKQTRWPKLAGTRGAMMAPKTDKETPDQKAAREQAEAEAKAESPVEQIARLKMEHEAKTAEEEKLGILTGDVAHARIERMRHVEMLEREAKKK